MGLRQKKIFELCRRYRVTDIENQLQNRHQKSLYHISRTRISSKVRIFTTHDCRIIKKSANKYNFTYTYIFLEVGIYLFWISVT